MHISQIMIREWKSYVSASFEFPPPTDKKNIVLIGAPNGYGKTSLLEALVLGLFGRKGWPLIARDPFAGSKREQHIDSSYFKFLEKALHQGALEQGRRSCSVKIKFVDDDDVLEIQRVWHFNDSGKFLPEDEEIQFYRGHARMVQGPPGKFLSVAQRMEWFQDQIAENLLPFTLARFFLFDGEQVSALAETDMSQQVRTGIEGLLGIPVLKQLSTDLRSYVTTRRRETKDISDTKIEELTTEINQLSAQRESNVVRLNEIEPILTRLKSEQTKIMNEIASFGTGSHAQLQELARTISEYEQIVKQNQTQLEDLLVKDIALALCGKQIRENLKIQLKSELTRSHWESGKNQGNENLERFLNSVHIAMKSINPSLSDNQQEEVLNAARVSWEKLWYPPPKNCADEFHHPHLNNVERENVISQLDKLDNLSEPDIVSLLKSINENQELLNRRQEEFVRAEHVGPIVEEKRERMAVINHQVQELNQEEGSIKRANESLESQINSQSAILNRSASQLNEAQPVLRRIKRAIEVASIVDEIVKKAIPSQIQAIADEMTKTYVSMARKKELVERIKIDENCNVQLLNTNDVDVRAYDLSAGEKQIFAQSLISAVSSVSGRGFPMVIDTPLGRLDVAHRKGVLKHLASRKHQVILLSTDSEVVGDYLREVAPYVQKSYLVDFTKVGDIGESTLRVGYFENF